MPLTIPEDLSQPYTRFGITIGRLSADEIEALRQRRNHRDVARFMIFQDEISEEQQRAWFERVDNRHNLYGTLYWRGEFIGLTNLRDIDYERCSAEGGMIIWSPEHQNSLVPFRAAIVGTDLAFWVYGFQRITVRVLASNKRALRYNRALGYVFEPEPDAAGVLSGWLTPDNYWPKATPLRRVLDAQDGTVNGGEALVPDGFQP